MKTGVSLHPARPPHLLDPDRGYQTGTSAFGPALRSRAPEDVVGPDPPPGDVRPTGDDRDSMREHRWPSAAQVIAKTLPVSKERGQLFVRRHLVRLCRREAPEMRDALLVAAKEDTPASCFIRAGLSLLGLPFGFQNQA
jgi:hypothetical protein